MNMCMCIFFIIKGVIDIKKYIEVYFKDILLVCIRYMIMGNMKIM